MSKLFEQLYRSNKLYYHVSPQKFDSFKAKNRYNKSSESAVFLTPSLRFVEEFADYLHEEVEDCKDVWLYYCKLKESVDIFNPSSKQDRASLVSIIKTKSNPRDFFISYLKHQKETSPFVQSLHDLLHQMTKRHNWSIIENGALIAMIKAAGFDGYASSESCAGNIALFSGDKIAIDHVELYDKDKYKGQLWTQDGKTYKNTGYDKREYTDNIDEEYNLG